MAACILIYILAMTVGFHNGETANIFTNTYFQSFYISKITLLDLLIDPIKTVLLGGSKFNSPYWVIRDMFFSSILIYLISFVILKIKANKLIIITTYVIAIVITRLILGTVIPVCITGALCGIIVKEFGEKIKKIPQIFNTVICAFCFIMPFGLHNVLFRGVETVFHLLGVEIGIFVHLKFSDGTWAVLYFALFIIMLNGNKVIQGALSGKVLHELSKISFGIYSFHWPLFCSVGALMMLKFPIKNGIILSWIVCISLAILISIFYHVVFEKNINKILKKAR